MNEKLPSSSKTARVNRPERFQVEMQLMALDQMLPADHRARVVWQYVESLDLEPLYANFKSVQGNVGRNAIAPEILLALWLMATIDANSGSDRGKMAPMHERVKATYGKVPQEYLVDSAFATKDDVTTLGCPKRTRKSRIG